ncbi:MAG: hypothetical protein GF384_03595 [Elusimicrobia bacterium]|nr:hypothetical protein [Elusimicrobiota bacterium]MBD3411998.1 hypothetical protein [Elusimicrobiota bacterium]
MINFNVLNMKTLTIFLFLTQAYLAPLALASMDLWSQTIIHVVSALIGCCVLVILWRDNTNRIILPFPGLIGAWLIMVIISQQMAAQQSLARMELFNIINGIFFFVLAANSSTWTDSVPSLLNRWGYVIFPLFLLAVYNLGTIPNVYQDASSMINPNIFSGYLVFWVPYWFGQFIHDIKKRNHPGFLVSGSAFTCALASLIITMSVTALMAVTLLMYCALYRAIFRLIKKYIRLKLWTVHAVFFIVMTSAVLFQYQYLLKSLAERMVWFGTAVAMIIKHPFIGIGPGGFGEAFLYFKTGDGQNTLYAHNIILELCAETGLIATGIFLVLLFSIVRAIKEKKPQQDVFLYIGLGAFILKNLFDYGFSIPANNFMFWFWSGLLMGKRHAKTISLTYRPWYTAVIVIVIFLLAGVESMQLFFINRSIARSEFLVQTGELEHAQKRCNDVIKHEPFFPEPYFILSNIYLKKYINTGESSFLDISIFYAEKSVKFSSYNTSYQHHLHMLENLI